MLEMLEMLMLELESGRPGQSPVRSVCCPVSTQSLQD